MTTVAGRSAVNPGGEQGILATADAGASERAPRRRPRAGGWALVLLGLLLLSVIVAVALGPADISPADVWRSILARFGLGESSLSPLREGIVWELRMPRVLGAAAVGAGLAICGAIMQAVLRNPLADPYLLGLSSGASFGAVIVIVLGAALALPVAAFGGAVGALLLTLLVAGVAGRMTTSRTILAGVAVSAVLSALTSLVVFWSATGDTYREILGWLLGSLAGVTWPTALLALGAIALIGLPLLLSAGTLEAFAFGDRSAASFGIPVERARWMLLGATALLTGCLVAMSGSIGFVGLVVPHAVRLIAGPGHRALLPLSTLAGAVVLIWADTLARTLFDPRELPVGIVTALLGGPVFMALLVLRARRNR
ncbi:iron chelate uptake ABC transporter family permease subunit [Microbacterium pseudoresistens]|uniref:Iron complex transport system permease protein n=1 Tax=Microbacterium pseudoresistens TaxID=640634 RepID=A0A7Y9EUZ3_9MICO|nr:putative F420-0 ABC transporter permease subunit [Microbacterium pseudoresistens]NYD54393.1 iron complex transport system permease protein [Microbacterium pseudoresistens]